MTGLATLLSVPPLVESFEGRVVEMLPVPAITLHAFCETPEITVAMQTAVADRRMSRTHATVHSGGIDAALELYRKTATPDLVLFESHAEAAQLYVQLDALADVCGTSTKVMVIGHANDIELFRGLLARGLSEYLVAPVEPMAIIAAISRLYHIVGATKLGRSFAFVGARGGAGSSTIAQNVAASMARMYGSDVILADLDLPFGSAGLGFNLDRGQGMAEALHDANRLDEGLFEKLLNRCGDHLNVLTAPASLETLYDLGEGVFDRVVDLARSTVPFVVLDIPHVWTSWVKKTLLAADEIVITAEPDLVGLRNTKNLVALLQQARPNDAPPKLVLNRVGIPKRAEIKPAQFVKALNMDSVACIAFEPSTFSTAANSGRMIADVAARSPAARHFVHIAEMVSGRATGRDRRVGRFSFKRLWGGLR
ncbi:AAA family ATPase [Reyranella sp.]|uniref:AAA family ATPase n=1 Tax=Reyranella sp. TaxID=1929291 RepID=UPI00272FA8A5|nr:AAA family ATPase [Reyranella sp.]MDP2375501.1 AAA family ATPase [Reyranella sp.]